MVPRWLRICLFERLIMPWRLPAAPAITSPEAVKRKRFFAADFVFILGILLCPFRTIRDTAVAALVQPGGWKPQTCVGDQRDKAELNVKGKHWRKASQHGN